jgi:hypothetical protein
MSMLRCFLPLASVVVLIGCGDGRVKLPTAPVAGAVTYQGKPLATGRIVFFHPSGQAAATDLNADGTFKLAAFQGKNQVAIMSYIAERPGATPKGRGAMPTPKSLIPERYAEPATSGLTFEVKPGESNKAEFNLRN